MAIKIDYDKCCWKNGKCVSSCCGSETEECEGCVEACPVQALKREDKVKVDNSICTSCGACVEACKQKAISLVESV